MMNAVRRLIPRSVDAAQLAASRLALEPCLSVSLGDAGVATLQLSSATPACIAEGRCALDVSTRFGRMSWYDYEAWLLALTGIDAALAENRAARDSFMQYALATLPAPLGSALGSPVHDVSADRAYDAGAGNDHNLVVCLSCTLPDVRVSMHLCLDASALDRMIEHSPWHPSSPSIAPRLAQLPSRARVVAGTLSMPYADIRSLASGDIVRLPSPTFDTAGVGRLVFASIALQICWRDADSSFEVQQVMHDDTLASTHTPAAALASDTPGPIDPARLPVQLTFVIGTLDLTLGALAAARSGSLLRLAEGMPPTVRIEANGVPIGYGELVDLDGRLAVEITQWHGASGSTALP